MRLLAGAALLVGLLASPGVARGNGGNTHVWISFHAIEHLPDGELRRMLERPELAAALVNGSVFPDGGYVVNEPYGETAHWEPFVQAYVAWMIEAVDRPFTDGAAAELAVFLLGVASHGMADQVFDATFMDAARGYDAAGWEEDLLGGFDTATDVLLVADTGVDYRGHAPWVPGDALAALYAEHFDQVVSGDELHDYQGLLHDVVLTFAVSQAEDAEEVAGYRAQYPWAAEHLMSTTAIGAPPCEGEIVAAYWQALWDRLHEASGPQNHLIASYPRNGAEGHPTDHTMIESQVVVVFGSGIRRDQLAGRVTVRDSAGVDYELTVDTQWGAEVANLVKIRPVTDWAADETFTVTIGAGLETVDGFTLPDLTLTFSTAPTDAPLDPTSDPTPHQGEPDVGRPPPTDGGCSAATASLGAALALLGLRRRRRR